MTGEPTDSTSTDPVGRGPTDTNTASAASLVRKYCGRGSDDSTDGTRFGSIPHDIATDLSRQEQSMPMSDSTWVPLC